MNFGMALHRKADPAQYVDYIRRYQDCMNLVAVPLVIVPNQLVSPSRPMLNAAAKYQRVVFTVGRDVWEDPDVRRAVWEIMRYRMELIHTVCVVDEPYTGRMNARTRDLGGLGAMIAECREAFPGKELSVNFNRKGLMRAEEDGISIPFDKLDQLSWDFYPFRYDVAPNDERAWKGAILGTLVWLRSMTDKPLTYVAQGWGNLTCPLTADNVRWSYEVAKEYELDGICYWFPQPGPIARQAGFSAFPEAEPEIRRLGLESQLEHHSQGASQ